MNYYLMYFVELVFIFITGENLMSFKFNKTTTTITQIPKLNIDQDKLIFNDFVTSFMCCLEQ